MAQCITTVNGIGESTKDALAEKGVISITDLANLSIEQLLTVKGFGPARAARAIAAAAALVEAGDGLESPNEHSPESDSIVPSEAAAEAAPGEDTATGKDSKKKKKKPKKEKKAKKSKKAKKEAKSKMKKAKKQDGKKEKKKKKKG